MGMMNPAGLQRSFIAWMKDCHTLTDGEIIAIDGKTLRGSYDRSKGKGTIHMVNAFATTNRMSIGQQKVDSKSNEITAIPKLLDLLEVISNSDGLAFKVYRGLVTRDNDDG